MKLTDAAKKLIANEGYDPAFGARPLKRVIQRKVMDALAEELLKGTVMDGDQVVADVDPKDADRIRFTSKRKKG